MRLKAACLVLMMILACNVRAAEVDCGSEWEGRFNIVDVFDPHADAALRREAMQHVTNYSQCPDKARLLGLLYRHGSDLPGNLLQKDLPRAKELLLRAAEAGNRMAYADLAEMALTEKNGREAMRWTQVYLYFVKSRKSFDGAFERSGYNRDLFVRASLAWQATKPRLRSEWIKADFNEYLNGKEGSVLAFINESEAAWVAGKADQPESGELRVKSVHACDLTTDVTGYATYLVEVHPDGHIGRIVLENFSPDPGVGELLRKCAEVYQYHPFGGTEPKVTRVPVFVGYTEGRQLNFKGR